MLEPGEPLPARTDLVLLPGSKSTLADLAALRAEGWDIDILAHVRRGGWVLGLCGGYQMLGPQHRRPARARGCRRAVAGLGLLDGRHRPRCRPRRWPLREARELATGEPVRGYEIHMGRTDGPGRQRPMLQLAGGTDGAVSADGRVMGCYLHGLLAADGFRQALLGADSRPRRPPVAYEAGVEAALDGLAVHLERCLDLDRLLATR